MRFFKLHASKVLGLLTLSLLALSFAVAQTVPGNMISLPLKNIDEQTIQLASKTGKIYTFRIDEHIVYCQGSSKVLDGNYLKKLPHDQAVTVKVSSDYKYVLVIWDQGPSKNTAKGSSAGGSASYDFPEMCK